MTGKVEFEVTEKAGAFVAGRRSPGKGNTIPLTEDEAYFALAAGELRRPGAASSAPPSTPAKKKKGKVAPPTDDSSGDQVDGAGNPPANDPAVVTE